MSVTGMMVVAEAKSHVGRGEVPPGSNTGPFVVECQRATFLPGTGWPWCAAFVCKVAADLAVPLSWPSAGANALADRYAPNGGVSIVTSHPGMVVDFNIGSGHTGILVSYDIGSGTITTIDGNWGDEVALVKHRITEVRKIWRIPGVVYHRAAVTAPIPAKRLPPFVVTTSASGHRKLVFTVRKKAGLIHWLTTRNLAKLFPNGITITRGAR